MCATEESDRESIFPISLRRKKEMLTSDHLPTLSEHLRAPVGSQRP
jgi:hypothetical protein